MTFADQIQLIKKTKQVHSNWYRNTYPDVANLGMDPAEHYLKYGAAMGRNPGKGFNTRFYLETYPDAVSSGLNPLVHYALYGAKEGRRTKPAQSASSRPQALKDIDTIRSKLLSLGFTEQPLTELDQIVRNSPESAVRAVAARELALWAMREKKAEGYFRALELITRAREDAPDLDFRSKFATIELLCHYFLDQSEGGLAAYDRAALAGEAKPDVMLARANFEAMPQGRCNWINAALTQFSIPPVALLPNNDPVAGDLPAYDRLTVADPLPAVADGPKVTVLIAAYEAEDMLPTALRSLQEQTWKNLEILVIDDCSPNPRTCEIAERFAAQDSRIRLIRMTKNGGAYVARNRGLDEATGKYVTIHDADDWSHPLKIESQVRFMEGNPEVMGCTSQQARATSDLTFTRWTGMGQFTITNTSSFMFRRGPMKEHFGYWDTARFSSDNELIRRMQHVLGNTAVQNLKTGPLSFQRDSASSIVANEALGINGFLFGARKEYLDAQNFHRQLGQSLRYSNNPATREFPIPAIMRADRNSFLGGSHFDLIIGSDFRMNGGSVQSCVQEIRAAVQCGMSVGLFEMYRYDLKTSTRAGMLPEVRELINSVSVRVLTFGETASCDNLVLRYPPILQHRQRYIPTIEAETISVVINQPPMSDYSEAGVKRYDLKNCAENVRYYFGKDATWYPNGPMVRDAIMTRHAEQLHHITLAPENWDNIIHVPEWRRTEHERAPNDVLRIGRHSRDAPVKWPDNRKDMLAIYPDTPDVEVHVLGGAATATGIIGHLPSNWRVHAFNAIEPHKFLAGIDVFIFFAHPDWVESFPRTVLEAMAVGVPVILPEIHRPLFGENALYATPQTALNMARKLYADPVAYEAQVKRAQNHLERHYSYEAYGERLKLLARQGGKRS